MGTPESLETKVSGLTPEQQIQRAREQLTHHRISTLAVLGPVGSDADGLGRKLVGAEDIVYHDDYPEVLSASAKPGVASLMLLRTLEGKEISHDATEISNVKAIRNAGRASIGRVMYPTGEGGVIASIVTTVK